MHRRLFTTFLSMLILALVLGATPVFSAANPTPQAQDGDGGTVISSSDADVLETQRVWTPEMFASAQPYPAPVVDMEALTPSLHAEPLELGESGFVPGGRPDPRADASAQITFPKLQVMLDLAYIAEVMGDPDGPMGTSGVYNSHIGNYWRPLDKRYPYKAVGKLYFTPSTGGSAYCSASVISPNNIIVTAAHCAYDTDLNAWHSNWVFVPAERKGVAPYGTFPALHARVLIAWQTAANYNAGIHLDIAVLPLANNGAGNSVTYYTGYLGRSWNYDYVQLLVDIGYPSNLWDGTRYTYINYAETYDCGTNRLCWGSKFGPGASGSPLIRKYQPYKTGARNYVNSVYSGYAPFPAPPAIPVYNIGARFTGNNIVVLCDAEGC